MLRLLTVELLLLHWWWQSHLLLLTGWLSIIILRSTVLLVNWLLVVLVDRNLVIVVWLLLNWFALRSWGNLIPYVLSWLLLLLLNYYFWSDYWLFLQLAQNWLLNCRLRIWNWHWLPWHFWQQLNRIIKPFRLLHRFVHTGCRFVRFLL